MSRVHDLNPPRSLQPMPLPLKDQAENYSSYDSAVTIITSIAITTSCITITCIISSCFIIMLPLPLKDQAAKKKIKKRMLILNE